MMILYNQYQVMKSLVIFDSQYGNTERVARIIAQTLKTKAVHVSQVTSADLEGLGLLVIGSPVQAGNATMAIQKYINQISDEDVKSLQFATFDTRIEMFIAKIFGYAADRVAKKLKRKGAKIISTPGAFIVKDKEGPLADGELERAAEWSQSLLEQNK